MNLIHQFILISDCTFTENVTLSYTVLGGLDGESNGTGSGPWGLNYSENELTSKQRHQLKHRELFLSRKVETVPATLIRGKCCVTLLNETESLLTYLNSEVLTEIIISALSDSRMLK